MRLLLLLLLVDAVAGLGCTMCHSAQHLPGMVVYIVLETLVQQARWIRQMRPEPCMHVPGLDPCMSTPAHDLPQVCLVPTCWLCTTLRVSPTRPSASWALGSVRSSSRSWQTASGHTSSHSQGHTTPGERRWCRMSGLMLSRWVVLGVQGAW